jgi:hypothetical protein
MLCAIAKKEGTELRILGNVTAPDEIDLLGLKQENFGQANDWGYKFQVKPVYHGVHRMNFIQTITDRNDRDRWNKFTKGYTDETTFSVHFDR